MTTRNSAPDRNSDTRALRLGGIAPGVVINALQEGIWLATGGGQHWISAIELPLPDGQAPTDQFRPGDTLTAFVWKTMDDDDGVCLSVRRNTAEYVKALAEHQVGHLVQGIVVEVHQQGFWLDIGGVLGWLPKHELALSSDQSHIKVYQIGELIDVFIWKINRVSREVGLSVRRNTTDYIDALINHRIGDIVSGTVIEVLDDGLMLDTGPVIGLLAAHELPLASDQSSSARYHVGDNINAMIWQRHDQARELSLSIRRAESDYVHALEAHSIGDVVSGHVVRVLERGLWVDVSGVIGWLEDSELPLSPQQSPGDCYAAGDPIDAFVWQVNHAKQELVLSVQRNANDYIVALSRYHVGEIVSGTVTTVNPCCISIDVEGVVGWIPIAELPLSTGESVGDKYMRGDVIKASILFIDINSRSLTLSAHNFGDRRFSQFEITHALIWSNSPSGIEVLIADRKLSIPNHELSLAIGERPRFDLHDSIEVMVRAIDTEDKPSQVSYRQALPDYHETASLFKSGTLVQHAQVIPRHALPKHLQLPSVDLGPLTGIIDPRELTQQDAIELLDRRGNTYTQLLLPPLLQRSIKYIWMLSCHTNNSIFAGGIWLPILF